MKTFYCLCFTLALFGTMADEWVDFPPLDRAMCETDTECAELCPEGSRDLPADHPDYCDGGPQ
jgi:hypothetical protein